MKSCVGHPGGVGGVLPAALMNAVLGGNLKVESKPVRNTVFAVSSTCSKRNTGRTFNCSGVPEGEGMPA